MPERRQIARKRVAVDASAAEGTHMAEVLSLLVQDPDLGYRRRELDARTEVPQASIGRVLRRLREEELLVKLGEHYFVAEDRVAEVERRIWEMMQFDAAPEIDDEDTAPATLDYTPTEDLKAELPDPE